MSSKFWSGASAPRAWLLTAGALVFSLGDVGMQLLLNRWNRAFYDALEQRSLSAIETAAYQFALLVTVATLVVMATTACKILYYEVARERRERGATQRRDAGAKAARRLP